VIYQVPHHSGCLPNIIYLPSYMQFQVSRYLPIKVSCPDTAANCTQRTQNGAMISHQLLRTVHYISHVN